jgi:hypothetical protein
MLSARDQRVKEPRVKCRRARNARVRWLAGHEAYRSPVLALSGRKHLASFCVLQAGARPGDLSRQSSPRPGLLGLRGNGGFRLGFDESRMVPG